MRQVEVSRTIVFDAPRRARAFFEAVVADNLDVGRPDEIKLVFDRQSAPSPKASSPPRSSDHRPLHPLLAANQPPAPIHLRQALKAIDTAVTAYINNARLGLAT